MPTLWLLMILMGFAWCRRPSRSFDDPEHPLVHTTKLLILSEVPVAYDIRNISGRSFASPIRNQMNGPTYCGCCWAMSTTSALVDRYALQTNGAYPSGNMLLSVQQLLNCGGVGDCNGGSAIEAAAWIAEHGIGDDTCAPYTGGSQVCSDLTSCAFCNDWYEAGWNTGCRVVKKYPKMWVAEFGPISPPQARVQGVSMVDAMKSEITARGPIVCNMATDAEWDHYTGGIILPREWTETDHLVAVSGWGEEGGVPYWIVR
jgi:hypothetical protein